MNFNMLRKFGFFGVPQDEAGVNNQALQSPVQQDSINPQALQQPAPQEDDFTSRYKQLVDAPSGPASQKYRDFISSGTPKREDYKPGKVAKLAAILGGASEGITRGAGAGVNTARNILDDGFNTANEDYDRQAKLLGSAANSESQDMRAKETLFKTDSTDRFNQKKLAETEEHHRETEKVARNKAIIAQQIADGRDTQIMAPKGGFISIVHKDGTSAQVTDDEGNPISSGTLSDSDLLNLKSKNQLKAIDERGTQTRLTEAQKQNNRIAIDKIHRDNPTFVQAKTKGGNIIFVNPKDPSDIIDTGVESGTDTDEDKIKQRGDQQRKTNAEKGGSPDYDITTTVASDGKSKVVTRKNKKPNTGGTIKPPVVFNPNAPPPPNSKAGGKWIDSKQWGPIYKEPS